MAIVRLAHIALVALAMVGTGCGTEAESRAASPTASTVPLDQANFQLTVSNQSFVRPSVLVEVTIDGRPVISERFPVGGQHNFVNFALALEPGKHTLTVSTAEGDGISVDGGFVIPENGRHYASVLYLEEDNAQPYFRLQFTEQPQGFA